MTLGLCTIFDSNYLSRGLALYQSLLTTGDDFVLWVLAMDLPCAERLRGLGLPRLRVVTLPEFETDELRAVKPGRTRQEYIWTCTPHFIRFCLGRDQTLASCTYVDPDVWFFSPPTVLLAELRPDQSVLITEHRFSALNRHQAESAGPYAVQFNMFRRVPEAMELLDWWCDRCTEWCFARHEPGRFGDQRYLDDWPARFPFVHVATHPGAGLGPWNFDAHEFRHSDAVAEVRPRGGDNRWRPVVFVHFHAMRFFSNGLVVLSAGYRIPDDAVTHLYRPYVRSLLSAAATLPAGANPHGAVRIRLQEWLRRVRDLVRGCRWYPLARLAREPGAGD